MLRNFGASRPSWSWGWRDSSTSRSFASTSLNSSSTGWSSPPWPCFNSLSHSCSLCGQIRVWLIVLVYVVTRLIPLPGASVPEEVDALGIAATGLEIAAVLLLAVALPEPATARRPHGAPLWWGFGGAVVFVLLWLILTGVVEFSSAVYASSLTWVGTDSWSALTPILVGSPLPHVWLAAPWWSLPAAFVLAVLVGLNLGCSTSLLINGYESSRGRRARLLALLPAGLAAPVCCTASTPLLALLGVPLFLGVMAAPFAALLSAVLLSLSLVFLRVRGARATCMPGDPRGVGASCDGGFEKEQGDATLVPGNHPGRRMI